MSMQNLSFLACKQTGLDTFLTNFEENSRIFQENSLANSKKFQIWVCKFLLKLAKHFHAKFQLSSLYTDGLRQIFDLFSRKIQDFLKENLEFSKSEKFWTEIAKRHLLPNFEPSNIFWKFFKLVSIFLLPSFFKGISKYQNSEYKVNQVGSNEACSQNFSFLALNTAEPAVPQVSSSGNAAWHTEFFFALNSFFGYKKS
jgi:hypothetical protein